MKYMTLEDELDFGKYEGGQLEDVIDDHPQYVRWLVESGIVELDDEATEALERREARRQ